MSPFSSPDFVRSRRAYVVEAAVEYAAILLVGDAFLAKLLTYLGLSDAAVGVISSLSMLAFVVQLLSVFVVRKFTDAKRIATVGHLIGRVLFMSIYLVPFLPFAKEYRGVLVVVCLFLAYSVHYFFTSMIYRWGNSFVDPYHRAEYSAVKEMVSLAVGVAVTLGMSWVMDRFEMLDNLEGAFIFFAAAIFVFSASDILCLLIMKKEYVPEKTAPTEQAPLAEVIRGTLGNKNFRRIMYLQILLNIATYMTTGFLGTYKINPHELSFTVGAVALINLLGNAARFLLTRPLGRYADRTSFARSIKLAFVIGAAAFAVNVFTTPTTRYLIIVFTVLQNISLGGTVANMMNITYSYVDSRYFVEATAIKNGVSGIVTFLASLLGGRLLAAVQARGNMIFGVHVYGQQILSLISTVLFILGILYLHFVIEKQTVMKQ